MNYIYKRTIEPVQFYRHKNAIIHYIHGLDYRNGILKTKGPLSASLYISGLLGVCNNATTEEKITFLQHPNSQRKLFKIINSLFSGLYNCRYTYLPLTYLEDLLALLALEPTVSETFYTSPGFIMIYLEKVLPDLSSPAFNNNDEINDNNSQIKNAIHRLEENNLKIQKLIHAAAQKYPKLKLALSSNQTMQEFIAGGIRQLTETNLKIHNLMHTDVQKYPEPGLAQKTQKSMTEDQEACHNPMHIL